MTVKKRALRVLVGLILGLIALAGAGWLWLTHDEPPPDDSDLRQVRRVVADVDNGFLAVDLKEGDLDFPKDVRDSCVPFREDWNPAVAREVVAKNAAVLARIDEALARGDFQVPPFVVETRMPYLLAWRKMADIELARIGVFIDESKEREAFAEALKLVRLGHRIQGAQGSLIQYLVGLAIKSCGLGAMRDLLPKTGLPAEALRAFPRDIEAFGADRASWSDTVRGEYGAIVEGLDRTARGEEVAGERSWWMRFGMRPNATRRLFAEMLRNLLHDAAWERENLNFDDVLGDLEVDPKRNPRSAVGRTIRNTYNNYFEHAFMKLYIEDFMAGATRLLLALKIHVAEKGALPESLDELVPGIIASIPEDPFSGKPLRYSREKRLIWSVGRDRIDAGGIPGEDPVNWDLAEPTVKIEP
jgi:hypothetical protein